MKIRAFITQHKAEKISECQDRFAVNKETKTVAVSDGVSQSIFPDLWAKLLVECYTKKGSLQESERIELCDKWKKQVQEYIEAEKSKGNNPWRTESNLAEGISAGATLCGLKFDTKYHWVCDVLGDSCLIKYGKDNSFEIISSEEKAFDTYPDFLDSNPLKKGRGEFKRIQGELHPGDKLFLVSDPFSDYFYNLKEQCPKFFNELLALSNHEEFTELVVRWREQGMHNDDSTVIVIEWDESEEFNLDFIDNIDILIAEEEKQSLQEDSSVKSTDNTPFEIKKERTNVSTRTISNQDFDRFKTYCKEQIPSFLDSFIAQEEVIRHTTFKSIIQFVFNSKKKKVNELRALLDYALNSYVERLK